MADINMCDNQECSSRGECYRSMATPSAYQSWVMFNEHLRSNSGNCRHFVRFVKHDRKADKAADF